MFENQNKFTWKKQALIFLGVMVLIGGIGYRRKN